ncbi:MAG TPA: hypothetical protein PLP61_15965, partial [Nocardioides sp.]|nr:hypothetical protein [Nocardioides sp.]
VLAGHGGPGPWWRVVRADGTPPERHRPEAHQEHLAEGTPLRGPGQVDLRRAFWDPADPDRSSTAGPR